MRFVYCIDEAKKSLLEELGVFGFFKGTLNGSIFAKLFYRDLIFENIWFAFDGGIICLEM